MIDYFKSLWLKVRKSNGLPGNEVLIPMTEKTVIEPTKTKRTRKKKDVTNTTKTE